MHSAAVVPVLWTLSKQRPPVRDICSTPAEAFLRDTLSAIRESLCLSSVTSASRNPARLQPLTSRLPSQLADQTAPDPMESRIRPTCAGVARIPPDPVPVG